LTFVNLKCRCFSVALLFQLLMANFKCDHNLTNLQVSLTVQLSKMVPALKPQGEAFLKHAVGAVRLLSSQYTSWINSVEMKLFNEELDTLLKRLSTILADSIEISRQSKLGADACDPTASENLLFQVADAFSHIPESRVEWLMRLAEHHQKQGFFKMVNLAEAGECYLTIAHLLNQQLTARQAAPSTTIG
jgi:hypothetical protein